MCFWLKTTKLLVKKNVLYHFSQFISHQYSPTQYCPTLVNLLLQYLNTCSRLILHRMWKKSSYTGSLWHNKHNFVPLSLQEPVLDTMCRKDVFSCVNCCVIGQIFVVGVFVEKQVNCNGVIYLLWLLRSRWPTLWENSVIIHGGDKAETPVAFCGCAGSEGVSLGQAMYGHVPYILSFFCAVLSKTLAVSLWQICKC